MRSINDALLKHKQQYEFYNLPVDERVKKIDDFFNKINNKENRVDHTVTYSEPCKHQTGWYGRVETFWSKMLGNRGIRIYCCSICGDILQGKELKEFKRKGI